MKYESDIRDICGDDWKTINESEKEGGYGVAMLISYIRGVKPSLGDFSRHLGVATDELSRPLSRLIKNGVIGREDAGWDVKNDRALLGQAGESEAQRIWGFIAALSSGELGKT